MSEALSQIIMGNYDYKMSRPKIPETPEQLRERVTFAVLVRTFRGAVGWSQLELAEQLGLSKASIAKLELGIMRLTPENKAALLELMKDTGVKFVMSHSSLTVNVGDNVIKKLDPKKAFSLPRILT